MPIAAVPGGFFGRRYRLLTSPRLYTKLSAMRTSTRKALSRSVHVTASDECRVFGSKEILRSAIENVVRNAVRYTGEGTSVEVSIHRERNCAVIRVRDFGPGVPDSMLSEIFLPFRRVASVHANRNDGSGLGLAIAQRAVAANGGKIAATNSPDGGLVITIEVPAHTSH